jgi:hypothetical protein
MKSGVTGDYPKTTAQRMEKMKSEKNKLLWGVTERKQINAEF